jgi:TrmH RNA methyltransferase
MKRAPRRFGPARGKQDRALRLVPPPREPADREIVYGLRAALAVIGRRPDDVTAVAFASDVAREAAGALAVVRARGVRVTEMPPREIERIAGSPQHEGLVIEARARAWATPKELADVLVDQRGTCIALDRVRNSYNVGAVLRSAAFFGVDAVLLGAPAPHPGLDPNAVRVAEGGAEHVVLSRTTDLADTLARLRMRGVRVIGTDGRAQTDALTHDFGRPAVVVMGNEREGLGPRVRAACDLEVAIRGTGRIESLNVGVAAGILLSRLAIR